MFSVMIDVLLKALSEYPKKDDKSDKFMPIHSILLAIFEQNISLVNLEGGPPQPNILFLKHKVSLSHLLQHMAFVSTMNGSSFSETMSNKYLLKPRFKLMMRFDQDGTELSTL